MGIFYKTRFLIWATSAIFVIHSSAVGQDNSQGRYRPDGRQIGIEAGQLFDERVFEVRTYEPDVASSSFSGAKIFYPLTLSFDAPSGAVIFMPGYRASASSYEWWGPALASLGYVVTIVETNNPTDSLGSRSEALVSAVDFVKSESVREGGPLSGKIDTSRIAIMGHSMGGGASLVAAQTLGSAIQAVIPLSLYCCEIGESFEQGQFRLQTPSLIIASATDPIAPPQSHAKLLYDSLTGEKIYMEFSEGDHNIVTNGGTDLRTIGLFTLAFLKVHLDGRSDLSYFVASPAAEFSDKFSRYEAVE
jgi:pimeloyl-ACP methyl ester carboxylesterase